MSIQGFSQPHTDLALWAADARHQPHEVRAYLSSKDIWFIPCLGSYKGAQELSYLTSHLDFEAIRPLFCEGQESVLILGGKDSRNRHKATLRFLCPASIQECEQDDVDLGRMYSVPLAEAHKHEAWTIPLIQADPFGELKGFICSHIDIHGEPIAPISPLAPAKAYRPVHGGYPAA